jgi:NADH-quinone oxidoreductase subunit D
VTTSLRRIQRNAREDSLLVNMGPSHPAMHGAVRIMLELDGERILNAEIEVGYLHRGFEKTCENRTWFNLLIYTDRLNYVSPLVNNHGYSLAAESLLGIEVPERAALIRVLLSELSRVSDHLTCLAAMAMECGAFTAFLYMMKAREFLWDAIEQTTGARMTTSFIRIGGVRADVHPDFKSAVAAGVRETRAVLKDVHGLLDKNVIFLNRTRDVGTMPPADALNWGWSGPALRSTGIAYDVRKAFPFGGYDRFDFEVPTGERGDNFDRYMVRMREMEQSLRIIEQAVPLLERSRPTLMADGLEPAAAIRAARSRRPDTPVKLSPNLDGADRSVQADIMSADRRYVIPAKDEAYTSIEGLISHFKFFMTGHGIRPPRGEVYAAVEGGNGELGYYLVSDGTDRPYRLHLRAPCLPLLASLEDLIKGRFVADIIPTFGSMNIILGELDR